MWQNWINAILGLWVVAVPFLGFTGATLTWTLVVTGAIIAALAAWSASVESSPEYRPTRYQHQ